MRILTKSTLLTWHSPAVQWSKTRCTLLAWDHALEGNHGTTQLDSPARWLRCLGELRSHLVCWLLSKLNKHCYFTWHHPKINNCTPEPKIQSQGYASSTLCPLRAAPSNLKLFLNNEHVRFSINPRSFTRNILKELHDPLGRKKCVQLLPASWPY